MCVKSNFIVFDSIISLKYLRSVVRKLLLNIYIYIYIFLSHSIRMSGKNINFGDKEIIKSNFFKNKKLFDIDDIDVNKILI